MKKTETGIVGAFVIERDVHSDNRGQFLETFSYRKFTALGLNGKLFVQGNESASHRLTLRGMHYQLKKPQAKLCWVAYGEVVDAVADIRVGSPTEGAVVLVHLTGGSGKAVYCPRGCAHGLLTLQEGTVFEYLCDDDYDPHDKSGIIWNDPKLNISWKTTAPVLSPNDAALRPLEQISVQERPRYTP